MPFQTWFTVFFFLVYIYIYIPGSSLSTFFLLIAVFAWIYIRSDFLCPLELENAHLFLDGRAFTFFSRVFTLISWENTLIFLASKCTKCKNAKSGAITLMWEKTAQKNRNLANKHLFVFSRIQDIIYIYIYTHIIIYIYSHLCQLQVSLLETPVLLVRTSFLLLYSTFFLR